MQLKLFKTLWGHDAGLDKAVAQCADAGFSGIEGVAPRDLAGRSELRRRLDDAGMEYIAEICTAGCYVPEREATVQEHLDSFRREMDRALECRPLFLNAVAGCDAWHLQQSVEFFGCAQEIADSAGITVSFETHRSRSLFNPWTAREILNRLPQMRVTCDFSHWCVVCERLIDSELPIVQLCAERAHHIHARVGYDQGPQVPDPAAPEYRDALEAHERWWEMIWESLRQRGYETATMTAEFGADGYLHLLPYTQMPVADLWSVNRWIGRRQQARFADWLSRTC